MNTIVYATGAVGCAVVGLAPGVQATAEVAALIVPEGAAYVIVDSAALPAADQSAWMIVNGAIVLNAAALAASLSAYADQKQQLLLGGNVWSFNAGTTQAPMVLTTKLGDKGQAAMTQLAIWAANNAQNAQASEAYSNDDYTPFTLTPAQAGAFAFAMGAIVSATRVLINDVTAGANANPPTITTKAQVDALAWPVPSPVP